MAFDKSSMPSSRTMTMDSMGVVGAVVFPKRKPRDSTLWGSGGSGGSGGGFAVVSAACVGMLWLALQALEPGNTNTLWRGGPLFSLSRPASQSSPLLSCSPQALGSVLPAEAIVERAVSVSAGGSYGEGFANQPYPWIPTNLPALCAVTVRVTSSPSSSYRFGLFLPAHALWKGRFLAVGNGGFAGGINWMDMSPGPHFGMATVSTDTGHNSSMIDTNWALGQPEKRADWGWRAMHGSVVLGKKLTAAYYGKHIQYSYFSGCSTGGRQGLREIQGFPDSFDGVLVGAPAWWASRLYNWVLRVGAANLPAFSPSHVPLSFIPTLAAEVHRQCDTVDGVADGIISAPELCSLDLATLLCRPGSSNTTCLSHPQLSTIDAMYNDYLSPSTGELLHPGLTFGSEALWGMLLGGGVEPSPYGTGWARHFLLEDSSFDWNALSSNPSPSSNYSHTHSSLLTLSDKLNPASANANDFLAMKPFRARGGKLVMYHGLSDGLVPHRGSELFVREAARALGHTLTRTSRTKTGAGTDTQGQGQGHGHSESHTESNIEGDARGIRDFLRLFLVPGMQHCGLTTPDVNAPWCFGGATHAAAMGIGEWSVPAHKDARHDVLLGLIGWAEKGNPVEEVVATTWWDMRNASSGVRRQRVLCPWPARARYDGVGDVDVAGSWRCEDFED